MSKDTAVHQLEGGEACKTGQVRKRRKGRTHPSYRRGSNQVVDIRLRTLDDVIKVVVTTSPE